MEVLCILIVQIDDDGLREIGESAFRWCSSLQSISIPSSVNKIGTGAFRNCSSLRRVVLSDGLEKIGTYAFAHCNALQSITIPSTVDDIGQSVFRFCTNLREVVLNDGIRTMGDNAFYNCTSLECITLPSTIIEIGNEAFRDCTELREVALHKEVQIRETSFIECSSLERFKFPGLSARLDNIIQVGQRGIEAKLDDISAVEWRGGELVIPSVRREIEEYIGSGMVEPIVVVEVDKGKLNKIKGLITYHEIKEATTLFELALWKAKIDQAEEAMTSTEVYRVEVPGPVEDTILQYLQ